MKLQLAPLRTYNSPPAFDGMNQIGVCRKACRARAADSVASRGAFRYAAIARPRRRDVQKWRVCWIEPDAGDDGGWAKSRPSVGSSGRQPGGERGDGAL